MSFNEAFSDGHVEWHSGLMIDSTLLYLFALLQKDMLQLLPASAST